MGFGDSDGAQDLMNKSQMNISEIDIESEQESSNRFIGDMKTDIESSLEEDNPFSRVIGPEVEALDVIYSALRNPSYGGNKLEGLRSFPEVHESVGEQTWNRKWIPEYEKSGLIDEENLTTRGEKFAEDEMPWWIVKSTGLDGLGEFYDILSSGKNQERGSKIEAFRLYGSGENSHTEVYSETGLNPSTSRTFANRMEELNILEIDGESYRFTDAGEGLNNLIDDHIGHLQNHTHRSQELPQITENIDSDVDHLMEQAYREATE
jgi:hypothetical protein